jgi:hypothetical protein
VKDLLRLDLFAGFKVFSPMDVSSRAGAVIGISVLTFVLNLFFGYFRAKTRKYSLKWFLCIHLPIPVIFLARVYSGIDYRYIPVFVAAAVAGQIVGGKVEI